MDNLTVPLRFDFNDAIDTDTTDYGLKLNSAYRNPVRNELVFGAPMSKHQYGRAIDVVPIFSQFPDSWSEEFVMDILWLTVLEFYPDDEYFRQLNATYIHLGTDSLK